MFFIDILDGALSRDLDGASQIFVVHQTCWMLWKQRNGRLYNNHLLRFSPSIEYGPCKRSPCGNTKVQQIIQEKEEDA